MAEDSNHNGIFGALLHPQSDRPEPAPLDVNLRLVIGIGSAVWALALIVVVTLGTTGHLAEWQRSALVCAAGITLGGAATLWERRHRARAS